MRIESAHDSDLPEVLRLLAEHQLPLDGVDAHVATMVVARDGARVVGAAAIEVYRDGGLLRSVVVDRAYQGQGLGHLLTTAALDLARVRGVNVVFLLTTTAEAFFPRFGFESIPRADVPATVQQSIEFQSACPASATVMRKQLAP